MPEFSILEKSDTIKYQAEEKLIDLSSIASQKFIQDGDPAKEEIKQGLTILRLLKGLKRDDVLSNKKVEAILYALLDVAEINDLYPSTPSIVATTYQVIIGEQGATGAQGTPGTDANMDVVGVDPIFVDITTPGGVKTATVTYNPFTLPTMNVSVQGSGLYEEGTEPDVSVDVTTTQGRELLTRRDIITPVRAPVLTLVNNNYYDPETFIDGAVDANATYLVETEDALANVVSDSDSVSFFYPFFHGQSDNTTIGQGGSQDVYLLGGKIIEGQGNKVVTFNGTDKYFYFCYPDTYPAITTILDQNGFDVTSAFQLTTESVSGTNAKNALIQNDWTVTYKVYRTILKTDINNGPFTFKF
ncbi:hypothetical protein LCGC14_0641670 [marine sediment metagenome]|uniref:Uncharacterized protein n=1 Tax=marine sediment metagenome TaxID=412755 RepID=A0A0F9R425_9ZZZZ|nr:hypothetical protein [Candidatus Aminicenantes bacterium]